MFAQQQMSGRNQSRPVVKTKPIISFQVLLTVFILFCKKCPRYVHFLSVFRVKMMLYLLNHPTMPYVKRLRQIIFLNTIQNSVWFDVSIWKCILRYECSEIFRCACDVHFACNTPVLVISWVHLKLHILVKGSNQRQQSDFDI